MFFLISSPHSWLAHHDKKSKKSPTSYIPKPLLTAIESFSHDVRTWSFLSKNTSRSILISQLSKIGNNQYSDRTLREIINLLLQVPDHQMSDFLFTHSVFERLLTSKDRLSLASVSSSIRLAIANSEDLVREQSIQRIISWGIQYQEKHLIESILNHERLFFKISYYGFRQIVHAYPDLSLMIMQKLNHTYHQSPEQRAWVKTNYNYLLEKEPSFRDLFYQDFENIYVGICCSMAPIKDMKYQIEFPSDLDEERIKKIFHFYPSFIYNENFLKSFLKWEGAKDLIITHPFFESRILIYLIEKFFQLESPPLSLILLCANICLVDFKNINPEHQKEASLALLMVYCYKKDLEKSVIWFKKVYPLIPSDMFEQLFSRISTCFAVNETVPLEIINLRQWVADLRPRDETQNIELDMALRLSALSLEDKKDQTEKKIDEYCHSQTAAQAILPLQQLTRRERSQSVSMVSTHADEIARDWAWSHCPQAFMFS